MSNVMFERTPRVELPAMSRGFSALAVKRTEDKRAHAPVLPGIDVFATKTEAVWSVLTGRFAERLSPAEFDHLYALFIFGLTSPAYEAEQPAVHLGICRELLERKLSPGRADAALRLVPETTDSWVLSAFETMERRGVETGRALTETYEEDL
ncbi:MULTISPECIES: hypothetical protein [Brucella]|uniref:hypothetical protein n=1 Tax=Brucella TaxID=234 RepID=UPI00124DC2E0|nr:MULTISPECIES: hypothetical protein [Brucella]KAB2680996.1 hypothetical protein F9K78_15465 [Brucella pseudintermedia]MCO7729002.1 hypothetical protein [Brucella intermedia]